jgi:hypothetical protein
MLDLRRLAKAITFTSIGTAPGMPEFAEMFQEVIDRSRPSRWPRCRPRSKSISKEM